MKVEFLLLMNDDSDAYLSLEVVVLVVVHIIGGILATVALQARLI